MESEIADRCSCAPKRDGPDLAVHEQRHVRGLQRSNQIPLHETCSEAIKTVLCWGGLLKSLFHEAELGNSFVYGALHMFVRPGTCCTDTRGVAEVQ